MQELFERIRILNKENTELRKELEAHKALTRDLMMENSILSQRYTEEKKIGDFAIDSLLKSVNKLKGKTNPRDIRDYLGGKS